MKVKNIILFSLLLIFNNCKNEKYKIATMTGGDDIDVTDLIESKEYSPVFCDKKLIKLKKTSPDKVLLIIIKDFNKELQNLPDSLKKEGYSFLYQYSYILYDKPVHVYLAKNKNIYSKIYFRIDNTGKFVKGLKLDESWVTTSCD